ncbi:MAG: hypothetical protein EPO42_04300 [Gallionellaceae bacterium]|nr:MAG: hypothetical protein EPO42_04300 [Gallionellaceae bacterium]
MLELGKTDWARVKAEAAHDAPIAFDAATDGYNPNDAQSVAAHWEGAAMKQGGVVVGRVRGANKRPTKEQVAVRYRPEVMAAFRASGRGWQTRMDAKLADWLTASL